MIFRQAIVALGSNTGDSLATLHRVLPRLEQLFGGPLLKSSLWQSTPVDCPPDSPLFLNAVVALVPNPDETPESLLAKLQDLEKEFGRQPKKVLNEPRPLDLDLITFGNEIRAMSRLTLPHPRAHLRRFVLAPLAEIAPNLILPGQTKTVAELLAGLTSDEAVRKFGNLGEE
jgi:2-amino-4-hydroxy-6-hydroxymethyldihydropteridine diphosphokinase